MIKHIFPKEAYHFYKNYKWVKTLYATYYTRITTRWISFEEAIKEKEKEEVKKIYIYNTKNTIQDQFDINLLKANKELLVDFINFKANLVNLSIKWFITQKDIIDFYQSFYPENKEILKQINDLFDNLKQNV